MSKLPVRESKKEVLSPLVQGGLTLLQGVLPALTAIVGGLYVLSSHYADQAAAEKVQAEQQKTSARSRYLDARKPFFEKQLATYLEAARVGGVLATVRPGTAEWTAAKVKFYALYWSELTMVEDRDVAESMVKLERTLRNYAAMNATRQDVRIRTYCLSRALNISIESTWSLEVKQTAAPVPPDVPTRDQCAQPVEVKPSNAPVVPDDDLGPTTSGDKAGGGGGKLRGNFAPQQ
ncbi:hypothetical protein ACQ86E_30295 [Bradyrhizobium betae]|uniref:hypothetical protein n=1 Tax=Bradyrhizobium betae TaxID=244734 RepID=UPI003D665085